MFLEGKPLEALLADLQAAPRISGETPDGRLEEPVTETGAKIGWIGESMAARRVLHNVEQAGPRATPVLIHGETGSGKERVAYGIHLLSPRADGPFIAVNCATLGGALIDSELFGHEKGAFTGAIGRHRGWFERANRGTLFLDEIGDLPLDAQAKFLRVLEDPRLVRVNGEQSVEVDVRVISATNRDLKELIRCGTFREDLYHRLKVLFIEVPPLRERLSDVPLLAAHFLRLCSDDNNISFSPGAMAELQRYPWPGNVRELRNTIEQAVASRDPKRGGTEAVELPENVFPKNVRSTDPAPPSGRSALKEKNRMACVLSGGQIKSWTGINQAVKRTLQGLKTSIDASLPLLGPMPTGLEDRASPAAPGADSSAPGADSAAPGADSSAPGADSAAPGSGPTWYERAKQDAGHFISANLICESSDTLAGAVAVSTMLLPTLSTLHLAAMLGLIVAIAMLYGLAGKYAADRIGRMLVKLRDIPPRVRLLVRIICIGFPLAGAALWSFLSYVLSGGDGKAWLVGTLYGTGVNCALFMRLHGIADRLGNVPSPSAPRSEQRRLYEAGGRRFFVYSAVVFAFFELFTGDLPKGSSLFLICVALLSLLIEWTGERWCDRAVSAIENQYLFLGAGRITAAIA